MSTTPGSSLGAEPNGPNETTVSDTTAQRQQIERSLQGAAEQAAEKLFALGLTPNEVGEFLTGVVAESDWMDYAPEEAV